MKEFFEWYKGLKDNAIQNTKLPHAGQVEAVALDTMLMIEKNLHEALTRANFVIPDWDEEPLFFNWDEGGLYMSVARHPFFSNNEAFWNLFKCVGETKSGDRIEFVSSKPFHETHEHIRIEMRKDDGFGADQPLWSGWCCLVDSKGNETKIGSTGRLEGHPDSGSALRTLVENAFSKLSDKAMKFSLVFGDAP